MQYVCNFGLVFVFLVFPFLELQETFRWFLRTFLYDPCIDGLFFELVWGTGIRSGRRGWGWKENLASVSGGEGAAKKYLAVMKS